MGHIHLRAGRQRRPAVAELLLLSLVSCANAFCPMRCVCNDDKLTVQCAGAALDVIPITLNPEIPRAAPDAQQYPQHHVRLHNLVAELEANTFRGLRTLLELQLRRNALTYVPSRAFHDMRSLERLDISHNQIAKIDSDAFVGLHRLKSLILRDNKLSHVPTPAFHHIPHLLALDLGLNSIPTVVDNAFSHLVRLRELNMDRCSTAILEPDSKNCTLAVTASGILAEDNFRALENLRRLYIVRSEHLDSIDERTFRQCLQLEQVVLEENRRLRYLSPATFTNLRQLTRVSLRANGFESFHPDLLPWNQLSTFDLRDNPIVCNCSVIWLWDLLRSLDHTGNWTNVRCHSPTHLSGELLRTLSHYDLDCDGRTRRNILIVGLSTTAIFAIIVLALVLWYRRKVSRVLKKQLDTATHVTYNGKFKPTPLAYI
ncbi:hypothetical protein MRX96_010533 [Rhipicephalus microplus]